MLLSADDLQVDGALDRAVAVMKPHEISEVNDGRARGFSGPPPPELSEPSKPKVEIVGGWLWFERVCQDGENPIAAPEGGLVRTSVHHQVGGYDVRLPRQSGPRPSGCSRTPRAGQACHGCAVGRRQAARTSRVICLGQRVPHS